MPETRPAAPRTRQSRTGLREALLGLIAIRPMTAYALSRSHNHAFQHTMASATPGRAARRREGPALAERRRATHERALPHRSAATRKGHRPPSFQGLEHQYTMALSAVGALHDESKGTDHGQGRGTGRAASRRDHRRRDPALSRAAASTRLRSATLRGPARSILPASTCTCPPRRTSSSWSRSS